MAHLEKKAKSSQTQKEETVENLFVKLDVAVNHTVDSKSIAGTFRNSTEHARPSSYVILNLTTIVIA